ncbi:MAG TPA: NAD(P)/FAD-dependent oxidoreductase [Nannocystaceae bacterium]|nr:NAD(P)/FAD-dependent oxidoreductase [Nannocystaceae bacterium]
MSTSTTHVHDRGPLTVVGGGLVGSLLAIMMARRGHTVDVFDRQVDPRRGRVGGLRPSLNLTLCERGLAALDTVGLREHVAARAVALRGRRIHAMDGTTTDQPYGNRGESIHSISRTELGAVLIEVAREEPGVRFHFEHRCTQLDPRSGRVRFEHADGGAAREQQCEAIFGADGAYSSVRLQLQKTELFDYSQTYSTQGYKELAIPATAEGGWALDPGWLHVWPRGGFMLIGFPNKDGSFALALHAPHRGGACSFEQLDSHARVHAFMQSQFPDVVELVPALGEQFFARAVNSMLTIRCAPWSSAGRVLLVGDAAHAVLPFYGQGANAGFEGCAVLDRCIAEHGDDWPTVFREYERLRRPNMDVMAELCVDHFVELRDRLSDAKFLLRKRIERRLEQLFPTQFMPLYSLISFTRTPYLEALRIDRSQRALVDRLLAVDGIAELGDASLVALVEAQDKEVA